MEITRRQIETYYEDKWSHLVEDETLSHLIEQTCKEFKLNKPNMPELGYGDAKPKPQNLGEI